MRRPTLLGLGTIVLLVIGLLFGGTLADTAVAKGKHKTTRTYRPAALPDGQIVTNSGRGQYAWSGQDAQPAGAPVVDTYFRDQVPWGIVEPTQGGALDTAWFDDGIARANAARGKFSFRVMAYCPGCFTRADQPDRWTPTWLPKQAGTDIPDWNSPAFLSAWESLMQRLGAKYANDPRLGSVDVGGFGAYGEWHVEEGQQITVPNAMRVVKAVLDNFPRQHVVLNAMIPAYVNAALAMSPRLGLRTDCLGAFNMFSLIPTSAKGSLIAERWKTQPVYSEWCHSGSTSTATGADQVVKYHVSTTSSGNLATTYPSMSGPEQAGYLRAITSAGYRYNVASVTVPKKARAKKKATLTFAIRNSGSAPTYDAWSTVLRIRNASGAVVATRDLGLDLRQALPGTTAFKRSFKPRLPRGRYSLELLVIDPTGYLAPMNLAMPGRAADGSYRVGNLKVGR